MLKGTDDCPIVLGCGTVFVNNAFSNSQMVLTKSFYRPHRYGYCLLSENNVEIYNRWGVLVLKLKIIITKQIHLLDIQEVEQL
jgi:hypothetical protein